MKNFTVQTKKILISVEITSHSKDQFYDKQLKEFGYENHPQEIWCRAVAAELSKRYIKQKM